MQAQGADQTAMRVPIKDARAYIPIKMTTPRSTGPKQDSNRAECFSLEIREMLWILSMVLARGMWIADWCNTTLRVTQGCELYGHNDYQIHMASIGG
jgi:hypothetical protein